MSDIISRAIIIAGPTASGKSHLALKLAQKFNGIIINADSLQIYQHLPILTASPPRNYKKIIPHMLYNFLAPQHFYSVAMWLEDLRPILNQALAENLLPIIVGGTGFYLKAFEEGLSDLPYVKTPILEKLNQVKLENGIDFLFKRLEQIDPITAQLIKPGDTQRIIRALSIFDATKVPLSTWKAQHPPLPLSKNLKLSKILLLPPRQTLNDKAAARLGTMIQHGAIAEIEKFKNHTFKSNSPVLRAHGAKQFIAYLNQEITLEEAINKSVLATQHYIKRQYTWFNHQFSPTYLCRDIELENFLENLTSLDQLE